MLGNILGTNQIKDQVSSGLEDVTMAVERLSIQKDIETLKTDSVTAADIRGALAKKGYSQASIEAALSTQAEEEAIEQLTEEKLKQKLIEDGMSADQANDLIIQGSKILINEREGTSVRELTKDTIKQAMATGALSKEKGEYMLQQLGVISGNTGEALSFKLLKDAALKAGAAIKAFFTSTAGYLTIIAAVTAGIYAWSKADEIAAKKSKERLKEVSDEYESVTSEIESLTDQISSLSKQINELDPITDDTQIQKLKDERSELAQEVALLKQRQEYLAEEEGLAAEEALGKKTSSKYSSNGFNEVTSTSTGDMSGDAGRALGYFIANQGFGDQVTEYEELTLAMGEVNRLEKQREELKKKQANLDKKDPNYNKDYNELKTQIEGIDSQITEVKGHATTLASSVQSEWAKLPAGELKDSIGEILVKYFEFTDAIDAATASFEALSKEQQKNILISKLQEQGLDEPTIQSILSNISEEDYSKLFSIDLPSIGVIKSQIENELKELEKGGSVNLTLRPTIDTSELNAKGWDAGEGVATVFSSTFSNEDETVAINFTPIIADPVTGEYLGVLTPDELQEYAEGVISGTRKDNLNLQIGSVYKGENAIEQAENNAEKIHNLHESYFTDETTNTESYGKAYAQAWLDGFKKVIEEETPLDTPKFLTYEEQIAQVQSLSKGLDQLSKIYNDVKDGENFDWSSILNNDDFKDTFSKYTEEYDNFIKTISNSPDDINACQEAFNKLATAYVYGSGSLNGLTEESKAAASKILKDAGITNAELIIQEQDKLSKLFDDYEEYIVTKGEADLEYLSTLADNDVELINSLTSTYSTDYNNWVDLLKQKANAYNTFISAIKGSELDNILIPDENKAKGIIENYEKYGEKPILSTPDLDLGIGMLSPSEFNKKNAKYTKEEYEAAKKWLELEGKSDNLKKKLSLSLAEISPEFEGYDSDSTDSTDTKETFDWVEKAIAKIQRTITNLGKTVDATYKKWGKRNKALTDEMDAVRGEITAQNKAAETYLAKANSVGLSKKYKDLVKSGKYNIQDISDEKLKEKIKAYEEWYNKYLEAKASADDSEANLAELAMKDFDMIASKYEGELSLIEHEISMIDGLINKAEADGHLVTSKYYDELMNLEEDNLAKLQEERNALQVSLNEAVSNGDIEKYSEDWYTMLKNIKDIDKAIQDATISLAEYKKLAREADDAIFDMKQDMMSQVQSESDWLIDLMSDEDMYDDNGNWTEYADATAGLHAVNYNAYMAQSDDYAKEIAEIDKKLEKKPYDVDLLKRRQDLLESQRNMISSAEDEKKSILDLIKNGYDAMLNSLQEMIDKRKEALQAEKDLYDYEKTISEKTKAVSSYEKQLKALEGDDSEEAQSKIQQIKVSLEEAKQDLEETEYDKWKSDQEQMLDTLYSDTEQWINERLDNADELLKGIIESTNANAKTIKETLETQVGNVGTTLSTAMSNIWSTGGEGVAANVVSMYGTSFNTAQTTTNTTLESIKGFVSSLANASDEEVDETTDDGKKDPELTDPTPKNPTPKEPEKEPEKEPKKEPKKKKWGSWFIKKKFTGNKKSLNYDTSIVDRLKWKNFDSSMSARAKYYKEMGGKGTYKGTSSQNSWMLKEMKKHKGYKVGSRRIPNDQNAWTQENGQELIYRSSDGAILTPLGRGDAVFTAEMTQRLWDIANRPDIFGNLTTSTIPKGIVSNGTNNNIKNDVVMNISLPNVVDGDSFLRVIQTDKRVEKALQSITLGNALGKNSLNKLKY